MPRRLAAVLAVALLSAAACGDSSDDQDPPPRGDDAAAGTTVRATDFEFDPALVEVDPGAEAEITFVNAGNVAHTFTAEDAGVDVEAESGQEVTATLTAPAEDATIQYVCRFHPQMKGEFVVGDGGSSGGGSGGGSGSDTVDY